MLHSKSQTDSTSELPIVRTHSDPPSGGYSRDREALFKWLIGGLAFMVASAGVLIVRHEIALSTLDVKIDLIMDHFGLTLKP